MLQSRIRGRVRSFRVAAWPLAALCLLASSRWLLEGARPELQSTYGTEAGGCVIAAGALALWSSIGGNRRNRTFSQLCWSDALSGAIVLTGTALAASISSRFVNSDAATLALSLTPVVVAVALPALGEANGNLIARMWPGLAGLAALLLLLPAPVLTDFRYDLALASMPLIAGFSAAYITGRREPSNADRSADAKGADWQLSALVAGAAVFGLLYVTSLRNGNGLSFSTGAAFLDGAASFLTLRALAGLGAVRWAAQFLFVPLLTMIEGIVFLRPVLDWRSWLALLLLGGGGGYLFLAEEGTTDSTGGTI